MASPTTVFSVDLPTTTVVSAAISASINRGRSSPVFDDVQAGRGSVSVNNENRAFDPLYAAGPYFGQIVPGRPAKLVSGGVTIFTASVADWNFDYETAPRSIAIAQLEDGLSKLGRAKFDEWTTTRGQQPGARLAAVIARPEVDYSGATSFDPGLVYLQDDLVTWNSNVLNYCQLITKTDLGLFYVDKAGVLTFKDRHGFIGVTAAATLGTGGIKFSAITTSYGTELLYNRVAIDREGGEEQVVTDPTSITAYDGVYSLEQSGLLMEDDASALDLATQLLDIYKDPLYRFESLTVDVHGLTSGNQTTVLGLDIGSVVTVTWTPNKLGAAISRTCIVEGIRHQITPGFHQMEFTLNDSSIFQTGNYYTVGHATYGTFVAGVMSYPVAF